MQAQINWETFCANNQDARGVNHKFEDLCRQLFDEEILPENTREYLHANPNNPGLETDPVYDKDSNQWIGFQVKYFDGSVKYDQIAHSADEILKYYNNKVDVVYLFCNKPLSNSSKIYNETVKKLQSNGIVLKSITDNAILDLVRKHQYLSIYYFDCFTPTLGWFASHTQHMKSELGIRYNSKFNIDTSTDMNLSLFLHDCNAASLFNRQKSELIDRINSIYSSDEGVRSYLHTISLAVKLLPDLTPRTLRDAYEWKNNIERSAAKSIDNLSKERARLLQLKQPSESICTENVDIQHVEDASSERFWLDERIQLLDSLIALPRCLEISDEERQLLEGKVLCIHGIAGIGKSQLLAHKTQQLLDSGRSALLLVAGIYFTDSPIREQIMKNLQLDCSFEDLVDILEVIGKKENCIIPILVDAINETYNFRLWKSGLPAIIDKVKHTSMVRLVLTYRTEYESDLIPEKIPDLLKIQHRGFKDNSISAIRSFLNEFDIPFSPLECFGDEMSNPLFLSLYCKTYNGEEVSLPRLYELLIERANENIFRSLRNELNGKGYNETTDILTPFISEISKIMVTSGSRNISREELSTSNLWSFYQITAASFLRELEKEQILHCSPRGGQHYFFSYDQMNDYFCAQEILKTYKDPQNIRQYLTNTILNIKNGAANNLGNTGLFVCACAIYAERYREECIDIIDQITDDYSKELIISDYIKSFLWRRSTSVTAESFMHFLRTHPHNSEDVWQVLIGNSLKTTSPLNANFLHNLLLNLELNQRDLAWTVYINNNLEKNHRIIQLIEMYIHGEKLEFKNEEQIELLLTLFSWLLTSSNRQLRDNASKAMVEILKEHFSLCCVLLQKFENVDDPYVLQRLYGIIFGACCKKRDAESENFKALAEYVFNTIFNKALVYPDILLRDYARQIIERFIFENPDQKDNINTTLIRPPYSSTPIPEIEDQHYLDQRVNRAFSQVISSMRFDGSGLYGDFGRYVFQAVLKNFDVDEYAIFNYAVYYVLNVLKFSEEHFRKHDCQCSGYDRHMTIRTERLGKKYQWIAMYNILARVSDHCKMKDYGFSQDVPTREFNGAWDLGIRDFDPTLNQYSMSNLTAPRFEFLDSFSSAVADENAAVNIDSAEQLEVWLNTEGVFHRNLKNTLILKDAHNTEWVTLSAYFGTDRRNLDVQRLHVWSWLYAFFVTPTQRQEFTSRVNSKISVVTSQLAFIHEIYNVFNREYPWAESCKTYNESAWVDVSLKTGEKKTEFRSASTSARSSMINAFRERVHVMFENPDWDGILTISDIERLYADSEKQESNCNQDLNTYELEIEKEIGRILHASSTLHWDSQYDASIDDPISCDIPCYLLIEKFHLRQLENDGFYFDDTGNLAAFDLRYTQKYNCVVIRKDLLDKFLHDRNMELIWIADSEKEIHSLDNSISKWSEWETVFTYAGDQINGSFYKRGTCGVQ